MEMQRKPNCKPILLGLVVILFAIGTQQAGAKPSASPALAGQVTSQEEGPMEGVLVSAKKLGSTVTISVVSDAQGGYSFPRTKLEPGRYALHVRAVGYDLGDPGPVEVTAQKAAQLNLKLVKTKDLAAQLTNTEWFMSWPGTEQQKMTVAGPLQSPYRHAECTLCHTVERIARSHYTARDFLDVMARMRTLKGWAWGQAPRPLVKTLGLSGSTQAAPDDAEYLKATTEYLASINLSKTSQWEYPLQTLPRPKGRATREIITEYDLPRRDSSPHDVVVAPDGMVWYCDFTEQYIGKLDPKSGKVVEYRVPEIDPGYDTGMNNLEVDRQGKVWVGLFYQRGLAEFDPKTEKFQTWSLPKQLGSEVGRTPFIAIPNRGMIGKVWLGGGHNKVFRVDPASGQWEVLDESRDMPKDSPAATRVHGLYGIASDSKNNLYELDIESEYIIKVDAETLRATYYRTPTLQSAPRRGHVDSKDRLWFAEYLGNKIGMFDTKSARFQEWELPTPMTSPYDVVADKNGEVWAGGMSTDRVVRLNPKTGEMTEYLMPRPTNMRRVNVDNSTTPVTFWVGNNDGASIVKVEPLD